MKRTIGIVECNYTTVERGPLTEVRPAASLPFHGRYRLVDFPLSNMVNAGIFTIGLIMPMNYRSIIDHVGAGKEWGLARKRGGLFPAPGSSFGAARVGGRFLLRDLLANKAIFTRNNYDYVLFSTANFVMNINYDTMMEAHQASGADITMLTQDVTSGYDYNDVVSLQVEDGKVLGTAFGCKQGDTAFLDAFIINRDVLFDLLDWYESNDHMDLFEAMATDFQKLNVQTYEFDGYAAPIFNMDSYYRVNMDLLNPDIVDKVFPADRYIQTKSHDTCPTKFETGCQVSNSLVSSSSKIFGTVKNSSLGRHVVIEPGAVVIDSILMQGTTVKSGARLENVIVDRNNTIAEGQTLCGTKDNILYYRKSDDYRAGTDN